MLQDGSGLRLLGTFDDWSSKRRGEEHAADARAHDHLQYLSGFLQCALRT